MDNDEKQRKNNGKFQNGNKLGNRFSADNQPKPEEKSEGWKKRNLREKLIEQTAEELFGANAPKIAVVKAVKEAEEKGNVKPLIDLLKLIKKPDKLELEGGFDITQLVIKAIDNETEDNESAEEVSAPN